MCWLSNLFKKQEEKPDWVTQTRKQVAVAEEEAAMIHYTWMTLIEDGTLPTGYEDIGGDYEHHEYWWSMHQQAAFYLRHPDIKDC